MLQIKALFTAACAIYNKGEPHYDACTSLFFTAHAKLLADARYSHYGNYTGMPVVPYSVFSLKRSGVVSRPVREDLFLSDSRELLKIHEAFIAALSISPKLWNEQQRTVATRVIYTAILSVACCYDLWQRGSRKTPGTFFEILMAAILKLMFPEARFSKHIPLSAILLDTEVVEAAAEDVSLNLPITEAGEASDVQPDFQKDAGVSTDLVMSINGRPGGIVIPLKITTRERIVQPFAHQRILDAAFGDGVYKSLLMCISETQLDEKTRSVKQVCVPGTIKLFQKYLARLSGVYYCDVPQRYAAGDMKEIIAVKSIGEFFGDVADFFD